MEKQTNSKIQNPESKKDKKDIPIVKTLQE
jgi:hypothetical protein